jgi:hypothetical protein
VTVDGVRRGLSPVESAALSGVGAAVFLSLAIYLLGRQPGIRTSADELAWYADSGNRFTVFVGLNLTALGLVAFLWFMVCAAAPTLVVGAVLGLTGAFAGPPDFLFAAWLSVVSITLLVTRRGDGRVTEVH